MYRIEDALKAASDTKALRIGDGILEQVADLFKEQFPNKRAVVVADTNTYAVAGKSVCEYLSKGGIDQDKPYVFDAAGLYAEYGHVDELVDFLKGTDAIPVAVGSGTINDLAKLSSHLTGRRYMNVGTAASVDGYTAYGASITKDGAKQTFSCPAPLAWMGDTNIIRHAPAEMAASGYADLFAKVTAGADWILSDALGVEPIDKTVWSIVQDCLPKALGNPQAISRRDPKAIGDLVEGLILSGFAMQAHRSSRPASGADHQFSHLWNMEHHTNHGKSISHGFQVSIGTLASTAMYEVALQSPISQLDVEACCAAWPTAEELAKESLEMFKGTDFPEIGKVETAVKYIDKQHLAVQLQMLKDKWPELKERLTKQLVPFKELQARLKCVGAPSVPEDIGVSREYLRQSYVRAQYIRRRFTILDLAVRTNNMDNWVNLMFGKGGCWE
jgi:glycerol-1-phosphate dehydrogenase [NAD(P)+]